MVTQNNVSEKCQFLQLYIKHDININIKMKTIKLTIQIKQKV